MPQGVPVRVRFCVTNDNGFIDGEGMLHILGRNDDIINVGGYKVAPTEVLG